VDSDQGDVQVSSFGIAAGRVASWIGGKALSGEGDRAAIDPLEHVARGRQTQAIDDWVVVIGDQQRIAVPDPAGETVLAEKSVKLRRVSPASGFLPLVVVTDQPRLLLIVPIKGEVAPPSILMPHR